MHKHLWTLFLDDPAQYPAQQHEVVVLHFAASLSTSAKLRLMVGTRSRLEHGTWASELRTRWGRLLAWALSCNTSRPVWLCVSGASAGRFLLEHNELQVRRWVQTLAFNKHSCLSKPQHLG